MEMGHQNTSIIILAAGKGTRMKSQTAKCLHKIAGFEMLKIIFDKAKNLKPKNISIVISEHMEKRVNELLNYEKLNLVIQKERLGTGHAVKLAFEKLDKLNSLGDKSLVLYGDCPLVSRETIGNLLNNLNAPNFLAVLGFNCSEKNSYGKFITKNNNQLEAIIEDKDADNEQKKLTLCNSGIIALNSIESFGYLKKIGNNNKAKEYYLTDIVKIARKNSKNCSFLVASEDEVVGVNSKNELAIAEKLMRNYLCQEMMKNGVTIIDPDTTYLAYDTKIAQGCVIYPNVFFGVGVQIDKNVEIKSFSHVEGVKISANCSIGPFVRIRPESQLGENVKIGNFVEVKNSKLKDGVKAGHLSYLGDADIGKKTNIGAGTITCNYDGVNKYPTKIAENVFIGSNSSLIAPISLERDSMIAAGTVVTKNVPKGDLVISRNKQTHIKDGASKFKNKK